MQVKTFWKKSIQPEDGRKIITTRNKNHARQVSRQNP
jgi:hypothetical protein